MVLVHRTVVRCVIRDLLRYVLPYRYVIMASESIKKRKKTYTLRLELEAVNPGGSNRIKAGSQIQAGSLIEAGGLTALF